jgi:hypothetical protein
MEFRDRTERVAALVALALVSAAGLVPPWELTGRGSRIPQGYAILFRAPAEVSNIDTGRLLVEFVVILATTAVFILARRWLRRPT